MLGGSATASVRFQDDHTSMGPLMGSHRSVSSLRTRATVESSYANRMQGTGGHMMRRADSPPRGFRNEGNTCYANATLQCLFSTALSRALLEPQVRTVFRRFSSNAHLLLLDSADEADEEEMDEEEKKENVEDAGGREIPHYQRKPSKQRQHQMSELCCWISKELTDLCRQHQDRPAIAKLVANRTPVSLSPTTSLGFLDFLYTSNYLNSGSGKVVDPSNVTRHVAKLSPCLRWGRQEDAHEFMRALIGALIMDGFNRELSSLFDGLLESAVTCQTCGHSSLTRDRYMDLSLEIGPAEVTTLRQALKHFTRTELLSSDNMVHCQKCDEKRRVSKGLRLATAPSILVCHLKRFECDMYGFPRRISKHVKFPTKLDLGSFMSLANKGTPPLYELQAIVVHQGRTCNYGHYLAYVRGEDGPPEGGAGDRYWYRISDASVQRVDLNAVLEKDAYILLYEVEGMRHHGMEERQLMLGKSSSRSVRSVGSKGSVCSRTSKTSTASRRSTKKSPCKGRSSNQRHRVTMPKRHVEQSPCHVADDSELTVASFLGMLQMCGAAEVLENFCGDNSGHMNHEKMSSGSTSRSAMSPRAVKEKVKRFDAVAGQDPLIGLDVISETKNKSGEDCRRLNSPEKTADEGTQRAQDEKLDGATMRSEITKTNASASENDASQSEGDFSYGECSDDLSENEDEKDEIAEASILPPAGRMRKVASSSNINERGAEAALAYSGRLRSLSHDSSSARGDSKEERVKPKRPNRSRSLQKKSSVMANQASRSDWKPSLKGRYGLRLDGNLPPPSRRKRHTR